VIEEPIKRGAAAAGKYISESPVGDVARKGAELYGQFAEKNPRAARNIEGVVDFAALVPAGKGAQVIGKGGSAAIKDARNQAKEFFPEKELPDNLKTMQPVIDAEGSAIFSKNPNPLKSGLEANQKISQAYDLAKDRTNKADMLAREIGAASPIPANDVYTRLDRIIASLEGKVAPGTKEAGALDQLTAIRDNLVAKNPPIRSFAGEAVPERTILPSDLMDIEKAINAGLPDNKFLTSGTGKSLSFKNQVSMINRSKIVKIIF
jgi:hypothetical protein